MPGVRVYHCFLDGIIDAVERGNEISGDLAKQCFIDVQQQLGGIFFFSPACRMIDLIMDVINAAGTP